MCRRRTDHHERCQTTAPAFTRGILCRSTICPAQERKGGSGGEAGVRTLDRPKPITVFETVAGRLLACIRSVHDLPHPSHYPPIAAYVHRRLCGLLSPLLSGQSATL